MSVLLKAVSEGHVHQVRLLLDAGVSVHVTDACGQTALIRAIFVEPRHSRLRILRLLLKRGARTSRPDVVGRNALIWAALYAREHDVRVLLKHADVDIDLNYRDQRGQTALFHAAVAGNAAVIKHLVDALLKYGMSVEVADNDDVTPLMQAVKLGYDVCANILVQQGGATIGIDACRYHEAQGGNYVTISDNIVERTSRRREPIHGGQVPDKQASPRFPPILSAECSQTIRQREERARHYQVHIPYMYEPDDDDAKSDAYSSRISDITNFTDNSFVCDAYGDEFAEMNGFPGNYTGRNSVADSARTVSLTSSTEAQHDSSDDDVDYASSPVRELTRWHQGSVAGDLAAMYRVYEAQSTSAYRPGAAKPSARHKKAGGGEKAPCVEGSEPDGQTDAHTEPPRTPKLAPSKNSPKWTMMRRATLRKNVPKSRLTEITNSVVGKLQLSHSMDANVSLSCDTSAERLFFPARKALALPNIGSTCTSQEECPSNHFNV